MSDANPAPPDAKRQGTMEQTAKDGVDYLKKEAQPHLIKVARGDGWEKHLEEEGVIKNGAENGDGDTPTPSKQETMVNTAKEGEELLDRLGGKPDEDVKTRGQQKQKDKDEDEPEAKKPKRDSTMAQTAKEAEGVLGNETLGDTRSKTDELKTTEKTPSPTKTQTMKATAEEAEVILDGDKVGESRSATAAIADAEKTTAQPKRDTTMQKTAKEGEAFVKGDK